ncbi:MAG: dipeptidyl-peptidase 3 family protein [Anaeromyxobacteraceae bacterium]
MARWTAFPRLTLTAACAAALTAAVPARAAPRVALPDAKELARREARYAPVDLSVDLSRLAASEREALARLVEAARFMDGLFLRQAWAGNEALLSRLLDDASPLGRARLAYFLRNKGPWDRLDHLAPFVPGVPGKPAAADFYPPGATKAEVERWLAGLAPEARAEASGFFTVVRRDPAGALRSVPYAVEYQGALALAAGKLREAARATASARLSAYLEARAAAFASNDSYPSDVAWMDLDAEVEPTIGPYETYEDGWFGAKAAFEAFVCVRDDEETRKVARFSEALQDVEDHLPIDPALRNPKLGALAPIRVVNEVFAAGDARRGVATAAFNLPNDERVVQEKGSKRVMLKNVQRAKFEKVLVPIAARLLAPADRSRVAFDAFFTHILAHELTHGLGPHRIRVDGRETSVRGALEESHAALEEAKADVAGLFALQRFIDRGLVDGAMQRTLYATYLASMFRTLGFGLAEAHGQGMAVQMSWFLEHGAVSPRRDGTFALDEARMREAVVSLSHELMTLQAAGDAAAARALLAKRTVLAPEVKAALARLAGVPVDIAPRFVTAEALAH